MTALVAALAFGLLAPPAADQDVSSRSDREKVPLDFTDAVTLPTGISPYFVVAVDLNRDGYLDLAASNTVSHSITVFLNQKNGTFGPSTEYPTHGYTPYALAAGDLDGDGDPDLVCGNMFSVNYSLFFNRGDGTFEDAVTMKGEAGPMFTAISDLDGDGRPDLALCNIGHDDVSVYLNRGGRQFEHSDTYACHGVVPYSIAAADFTGDGRPDLVTGNIYSSNVSLLENLGQGRFGEARTFKTESLTQIVFPADFNGDGRLDLVTGNGGSDNVSVLINDGKGGFLPAVNYAVKLPQGVTAGDIDGDGDIDIATANQSANTTSVLLNRGDGTFLPAVDFQVQGLYPTGVLMADLDGNGRMDLVTANSGSNNVSILYNAVRVPKVVEAAPSAAAAVASVDGRLPQPVSLRFNTAVTLAGASGVRLRGTQSGAHEARVSFGPDPSVVQVEPFVSKGNASPRFFAGEDVVVDVSSAMSSKEGLRMKSGFESAFTIQTRLGTGRFERREELKSGPLRNGSAADLDGDGRLDVVALPEGGTAVTVYFNGEKALFQDTRELPTGLLDPGAAAVVDVDGDGLLDIVVTDRLLPAAAVLLNGGKRDFLAAVPVSLSPDGQLSRPVAMVAADWNGDGLVDIATANRLTDDITVAFNSSGRAFLPAVRIPVGNKPVAIASCDLDGNGVPDLLTVNTRADTASLFINDGKGTFVKKDELALLYGDPRQVLTTDLNRDGASDLLIVDPTSNELVRFQNNGDGSFRRPDYIPLSQAPLHVAAADVDADGVVDLVVGHAEGVTVLRGTRDGKFEGQTVAGFPRGSSPIPGDFDGDGAIDLVVCSEPAPGEGGLTLFANATRGSAAQ